MIEPIRASELFQWGKSIAEINKENYGARIIDYSVMNIVQPNFTADPIFEGIEDPITDRSVVIRKDRGFATLSKITHGEPEKPGNFVRSVSSGYVRGDSESNLRARLDRISGGAGECYYNMYGALMWYICSCHGRGLDPDREWIVGQVSERVMQFRPEYASRIGSEFDKAYSKCPYPKRTAADIEQAKSQFIIKKRQQEMSAHKDALAKLKSRLY